MRVEVATSEPYRIPSNTLWVKDIEDMVAICAGDRQTTREVMKRRISDKFNRIPHYS